MWGTWREQREWQGYWRLCFRCSTGRLLRICIRDEWPPNHDGISSEAALEVGRDEKARGDTYQHTHTHTHQLMKRFSHVVVFYFCCSFDVPPPSCGCRLLFFLRRSGVLFFTSQAITADVACCCSPSILSCSALTSSSPYNRFTRHTGCARRMSIEVAACSAMLTRDWRFWEDRLPQDALGQAYSLITLFSRLKKYNWIMGCLVAIEYFSRNERIISD